MNLKLFLKSLKKIKGIYVTKNKKNIFVNNRNLNSKILNSLKNKKKNEKFKKNFSNYWDMVFSPKREVIIEFLDINKKDTCGDLGSMWGVHTVSMAKRAKKVFSVDQTYDSLEIVKRRCEIEKLNNVTLINDDLKKFKINNHFDKILVNGVLEWIPTIDNVVLSEEYGKKLIGHLMSDDFFSVDSHPTANLNITAATAADNGAFDVSANLTIKGITHPANFKLMPDNGNWKASLTFDRAQYEVRYGSGSFFENLGDKLILDEITLETELVFAE